MDARDFTPQVYQQPAMEFLCDVPRANLFADMGMGKTAICLWLIDRLNLQDVLIVGPKRVAQDVWPKETRKWKQFQHLNVVPVIGERRRKVSELLATPRIMAINYEELLWLWRELGDAWPFTTVICDESRRLMGYRTQQATKRSNALAQMAHKRVTRWINLTGTPNPKGLTDLWGPQWFIDGGRALGRTYSGFQNRWFYREAVSKGIYQQLKPFPNAQADIEKRLRSTTLSIRARDYFDVREPIEHIVSVELPEGTRAQYRQMHRHFFAELEGGLVTAANCAVRSGKLLQFSSGAVYHQDNTWSEVHQEKLEALESIIEETGCPLLIAYQFVHEYVRIKQRFARAVDIREKGAVDAWNAGKIRLLLCHPKSAGHGLNLQDGGHHIVYYSPTWDTELYHQVLERIGPVRQLQSGYDRPVYIHHIIANNTLDQMVLDTVKRDGDAMEALLDAMREIP